MYIYNVELHIYIEIKDIHFSNQYQYSLQGIVYILQYVSNIWVM